jgi:small multidrug resistance pump
MVYLQLAASIIFEVIGTSLMKKTDGFSNIPITAALLACYAIAFYFMSVVTKILPVGMVYATWSGCGIVLVSAIGYFAYQQKLDRPAVLGMALIIAGVILINGFSKSAAH